MRKYCEENERIKRKYAIHLRNTKGRDIKSLDKIAAALVKFEQSTKCKPFKKFHIDQAVKFKAYLDKAKNPNNGNPLSFSTIDATLRMVKGFFQWLADQPGYKSRINFADVRTVWGNQRLKNETLLPIVFQLKEPKDSFSVRYIYSGGLYRR